MINAQLWHYRLADEEYGPVDVALLKHLIEQHRLLPVDWVRPENDPHWRPVSYAPEILSGEIFDQLFEGTTAESFTTTNRDSEFHTTSDHDSMPASTTTTSSQDAWYYKVFGQEMGPISFDELNTKTHNFEISREDEVRLGSNGAWVTAESIDGLFSGVDEMDFSELESVGFIAPQRSSSLPKPPTADRSNTTEPVQEAATAENAAPYQPVEREQPNPRPVTPKPAPKPPQASSPPASRPTPRPQFTPTKKSRSSSWSFDFSLSDIFANISMARLDAKFYVLIGIVVLYGGYLAMQPLFAKATDAIYLKRTADLIAECKNSGKSPDQIAQEIQPRIEAMKAEIEEKASADRPVLRILLETHREHFPVLLNGKPQEQQDAMRRIESNLNAARQLL